MVNRADKVSAFKKLTFQDFPGGPVVKTPASSSGAVGSIRSRGTKIPHAAWRANPPKKKLKKKSLHSSGGETNTKQNKNEQDNKLWISVRKKIKWSNFIKCDRVLKCVASWIICQGRPI